MKKLIIPDWLIEDKNRRTEDSCKNCMWLDLDENKVEGYCECPHNEIEYRWRFISDKKCSWKNADQVKMEV